jgi:hypothetical protein
MIVDKSYIGKTPKAHFAEYIRFGTYKLNSKTKVKEDHIISPEDMQAHKVLYINS